MSSSDKDNAGNGFWLDGESPTQQTVRVALLETNLRFALLESRKPQLWEFADIDWEASRTVNGQLRLKRADADQWLVITAAPLIAEIAAERRQWGRGRFWRYRPDARLALRAGAGTVALLVGLWLTWPSLTYPIAGIIPTSTREWLGNSSQSLIGMDKVCTAPAGNAALQRLVSRLTADDKRLATAKVEAAHSPMVNALTLANDKIVITSAIIAQAASPDEVAGIIAHELGHVAHRHVLRGFLGNALMKVLILLFTGTHGEQMNYANDLTSKAHSRRFEAEADNTALDLLRNANIASTGLSEFFYRLTFKEGKAASYLRYFSDHPVSADRAQRMRDGTATNTTPALSAADWQALKQICGAESAAEEKQAAPRPNMNGKNYTPLPPSREDVPDEREHDRVPAPDPNEQRDL